MVAINKWDLVAESTADEYRGELRDRYPFLRNYPVLCISGLTGRRVHKCLEVVAAVGNKRRTRIPHRALEQRSFSSSLAST